MISVKQIVGYLTEQPFQPFQIRMASGRTFDVRHPEMALAGVHTFRVYTAFGEEEEKWHDISLTLMESIEPLASSNPSNGQ